MATVEANARALAHSNALLIIDEAIIELLPAAVYVCDASGFILRYNRRAAELWGQAPTPGDPSVRFCGAYRLFHPDGRPLPHDEMPIAEVLKTGRPRRDLEIIIEQPGGRRLHALVNIEPIKGPSGEVVGAINCLVDVTARKAAEDKLRESERRSRELLEGLPVAVYTTDAAGRINFCNAAAIELWGRAPAFGEDRWCGSWRLYRPDGTPMRHDECPMAAAIRENRPVRNAEAILERPDGTRVPFMPYPTPLRGGDGALVGAVNMLVDITHRKRGEERQQLLINELNHRVKNTLATVQSIAAQSFRGRASEAAQRWFEGRLVALSNAHDVLTRENWEGAQLSEIVSRVVAPLRDQDRTRFAITGPDLRLTPKMALALAMAVHELCTNAAKYGALANASGRVIIGWRVVSGDGQDRLRLSWAERDGPPVEAPRVPGFGTRMIERGLARELAATVSLSYAPSGVVCEIDAPLPGAQV